MTRTTTGLTVRCIVSMWLAQFLFSMPTGWTLCGTVGLLAIVGPWYWRWVAFWIDFCMAEHNHCYKAIHRSVDRASRAT